MYLYFSGGVVGKMAGCRDVKSSIGGQVVKKDVLDLGPGLSSHQQS